MPRTFFKNWWWNKISPFRIQSHFTPCYIFILNQSHIVSSRHGDISSVPKISLCSQRALNITESTLRTLLYLTFWELADICSNLYRGGIEIQRRRESCKEQGNCSEEYSVPHKQKPKQRARTSAGTGIRALIMREEASKSNGVLFCQGIRYIIKRHSMLCRPGVLAEEENHMCEAYTPSVVLGLEVWGQQIKRKEKWEQKWHLEWKPWQQRHGAGEAGIVASGLTARQREWREHRLALTLMYARLSEGRVKISRQTRMKFEHTRGTWRSGRSFGRVLCVAGGHCWGTVTARELPQLQSNQTVEQRQSIGWCTEFYPFKFIPSFRAVSSVREAGVQLPDL